MRPAKLLCLLLLSGALLAASARSLAEDAAATTPGPTATETNAADQGGAATIGQTGADQGQGAAIENNVPEQKPAEAALPPIINNNVNQNQNQNNNVQSVIVVSARGEQVGRRGRVGRKQTGHPACAHRRRRPYLPRPEPARLPSAPCSNKASSWS